MTTEEIYEGLERGDLLHKLQKKLGGSAIDLSIFQPGGEETAPTHAALYDASQGFDGKGECTAGLHFLIDCVLEAIQRENWDNSPIRGPVNRDRL